MIIKRKINGEEVYIELTPDELADANLAYAAICARNYIDDCFCDDDIEGTTKAELLGNEELMLLVGDSLLRYREQTVLGDILPSLIEHACSRYQKGERADMNIRYSLPIQNTRICPKCNYPVDYNSYFHKMVCRQCGWMSPRIENPTKIY